MFAGDELRRFLLGAVEGEEPLTAEEMVRIAESFYTSLGFDPLPKTFWERSMFVRPRDRHAQTHGMAYDMYDGQDVRIRMGILGAADDFYALHHELGHNFYYRAYARQPFLYRMGANTDFHEAVADTIGLSITPKYLARIGLGEDDPPNGDIPLLLRRALSSVASCRSGTWWIAGGMSRPARHSAPVSGKPSVRAPSFASSTYRA